ncbi:MAG: hypothetical protein ACR2OY_01580 [Boseongicola sp.]
MRNTILIMVVAGAVTACGQAEQTEFVWTPDSEIKIDGETYVIKSRTDGRGGKEVFIVVNNKTYRCEGTQISEENCRSALQRGLRASAEEKGDDY